MMDLAIKQAYFGKYKTYLNPMVGAIIVKDGKVISKGHHLGFGYEHAEVNAKNNVQDIKRLKDATMYVTLEPCSHYGKTPPCAKQIVDWGIKKVFIGQLDPNPIVSGKGIEILKRHGIEVVSGIRKEAAININPFYNHYFKTGRPFITLKMAQTLDGKINLSQNHRTYLTNDAVNQDVQNLRADYQSILVGSRTVQIDDPRLTVRNRFLKYPPVRIIVDFQGTLSGDYHIFKDAVASTYWFTNHPALEGISKQVTVFNDDSWTLVKMIEKLADLGLQSILVEGGSQLHDGLVEYRLFDQLIQYVVSKIAGGDSLPAINSLRRTSDLIDLKLSKVQEIDSTLKITSKRRY